MDNEITSNNSILAHSNGVAIRHITAEDLEQISKFPYTVSITEPLSELEAIRHAFRSSRFWKVDAGAVAIVEMTTCRLVGTSQFYRSAPCIHGYELGYIIHEPADRRHGYASQAVRLFSDYLFTQIPTFYRQQLMIEVWNTASWKLAERCGFVREGLLRSSGFGKGDPSDCFLYSRTRKDWHEEIHTSISMGGAGV